mmetsp:Transcript_27961/g.20943  ORF Transcript_27961/g.20943 Transcript_27961/m.20943 type:complete len:121 (+) Transcript_27961:207-569(+)|eukprot:CAMPEP_0202962096 /NCGR_PEP_ID=MMETSP1396-20130829/6203_1 /ASSEMBLY_ACC=CAM_ASM_000872 /TAXON_ID= /ORGANISM="Pseudokeronopsis sp., Strain Brazil" /LENGTH=120 /DNA_ID=CAMNT_0049682443 /DNA_START=181 /DNA_END=543 /DNA_ORIENTATION=+
MQILKEELMKELSQYPITPQIDPKHYVFTKEFYLTLTYKLIYKYQVIAKEIVKEDCFIERLNALREKDDVTYSQIIAEEEKKATEASLAIKDIVFDYFNIINKQFEITTEFYRKEEDYQK